MFNIEIILTGKVQGVFFRNFIFKLAQKLDLKGGVKNLEDKNKILIRVSGDIKKVFDFLHDITIGNGRSKVESVKINKIEEQQNKFEVWY